MSPDLAALRDLAVAVAQQAGALLQSHQTALRNGADLGVSTKSSDTDPVSQADREAERAMVEAVTSRRPDDGLLGEEGAERRSRTGIRWVLDPLDGTVNFLYGHVGWAVSVGVEAHVDLLGREPDGAWSGEWVGVAGAVVEPSTGTVYAAARGRGATRDDRSIQVNEPVVLGQALVATGFDYDPVHRRRQAAVVAGLIDAVRDIRRVGSAALDCCRVADGQVDAYYEDSTNRWDWSAGAVIAIEAGAVVSPLTGPPGRGGLVVAGPTLHDELRRKVTT